MGTDLNQTAQARASATKAWVAAQTNTRLARAALVSALAASGITLAGGMPHRRPARPVPALAPTPTPVPAPAPAPPPDFNALVASLSGCIAAEAEAKVASDKAAKTDNDARAAVGVS